VCGEWHSLQAVQRCSWHHPCMAKLYHLHQSRISSWPPLSPSQSLLSLVCGSLSVLILYIYFFSCFVLSPTSTLLSPSFFSVAKKTLNHAFQLMGLFLFINMELEKFEILVSFLFLLFPELPDGSTWECMDVFIFR
jgi:hypothetical protein